MIRTLRIKFVAINMALVSLVLAVVFGCLLVSSARAAAEETASSLRMALDQREGQKPSIGSKSDPAPKTVQSGESAAPGTGGGGHGGGQTSSGSRSAVFWVLADDTGAILQSDTSAVSIADETLADVTARALADGADEGTLADPDLRFMLRHTPDGTRIAFADRSAERSSLRALAVRSLAVGVGALGAFFVVSLLLARLALRPVERAWQQQRQFVADASHELKTPLTVILANVGILARHPQATVAEEQKWVDGIADEAARMKALVDDLLFLARADALRAPAAPEAVDLSSTVESAALGFESVAFERGVVLESAVAPGLTVQGDPKQLAQLAAILLDNACKYAPRGGTVRVKLEKVQSSAVFTVQNTGPTLTAEELSHLFERFYRTDSARTRGGYGLGLSIAHTIVQSHGGQLRAASADGVTVFTAALPMKNKERKA